MDVRSIYLIAKDNELSFLRYRHNLLECALVYKRSGRVIWITASQY